MRSLLLFLFLAAGGAAFAANGRYELRAEYFVDSTAALTPEQVVAAAASLPWKPYTARDTSFGLTSARVWIRFRLPSPEQTSTAGALFLEVENGYIERIDIHTVLGGVIRNTMSSGLAVPVSQRGPHVLRTGFHAFRFLSTRDKAAEYYLSARSTLPLAVPLELWDSVAYPMHHWHEALLIGLYLGCLLIAALYNAFLAISLRSRLYGGYALFVGSMVAVFLATTGLNVQFLYPEWPWWAVRDMHFWGSISLPFYVLFVREFLGSARLSPWLDRLFLLLAGISLFRIPWILLFGFHDGVLAAGVAASAAANMVALVLGVKALRSGQSAARYFFYSSLSFNVFIFVFLLQELKLIWIHPFVPWSPFLGTLIEISLLSLAMADRIRSTQRELRRQKAAVVHADKLGALGRMAGEIAHEINNPLAIIHGNAVLMRKHLETAGHSPADVAKLAETIEATAMRITRLVKSMRSLARDSRQDPARACSLRGIVQDAAAICQDRFTAAGVKLEVGNVPEGLTLPCRSSEISQVLVNLLSNSLDALKSEGPGGWVRVEVEQKAKTVQVAVVDNGPGVPKTIRARIHEPFFTTKEAGSGLGLGLSISRTIIEEGHKGRLWLDETSDHTRFTFELPAEPAV